MMPPIELPPGPRELVHIPEYRLKPGDFVIYTPLHAKDRKSYPAELGRVVGRAGVPRRFVYVRYFTRDGRLEETAKLTPRSGLWVFCPCPVGREWE